MFDRWPSALNVFSVRGSREMVVVALST